MTVTGPIGADALGVTLPHEHVLINLYTVTRNPDHVLDDPDAAAADLSRFAAAGGSSLIDCTSRGLGGDPVALRDLSLRTGVNIIAGCGWYREPFIGQDVDRTRVTRLAEELVAEIEGGIVDGIRPGVIGEIGADREWLSGVEERALRAAGRAHMMTGLPIITHALFAPVGLWQLDVLEEEGVDPRSIAVSHGDSWPDLAYHRAIIERGAFVLYDRNGPADRLRQARRLQDTMRLVGSGHGHGLMLSHDVCASSDRAANGGSGYDYILDRVVPDLEGLGLDDAGVRTLLVDNPRRFLARGSIESTS